MKPAKGIFNGVIASLIIWIILFALISCACGVQAQLPAPAAVGTQAAPEVSADATPAHAAATRVSRKAVICDSGGLNVRSEPGADAPKISEKKDGDTVTLMGEWQIVDGGIWLRIGGGWVNGRYVCLMDAR